jgi:hypothetical protein
VVTPVRAGKMNMDEPAYLTELKQYGAGDPTLSDIEAVEDELYKGPDRAAAIVMGSMVEKAIGKLLSDNMRESDDKTFFRKIEISYSLNLFPEKAKKELDIIRCLRNQFAHSRLPIEFITPVVKRCCDELTCPDVPSILDSVYSPKVTGPLSRDGVDISQPRTRFFISCHEIFMRIYFFRAQPQLDW